MRKVKYEEPPSPPSSDQVPYPASAEVIASTDPDSAIVQPATMRSKHDCSGGNKLSRVCGPDSKPSSTKSIAWTLRCHQFLYYHPILQQGRQRYDDALTEPLLPIDCVSFPPAPCTYCKIRQVFGEKGIYQRQIDAAEAWLGILRVHQRQDGFPLAGGIGLTHPQMVAMPSRPAQVRGAWAWPARTKMS